MSTTTPAGTHTFTASAEDRTRCTCGKSRNTSVHGYNVKARSAAQAGAQAATAKAEKVTAKAQAQADTAAAAEDAVTAVYEKFAAARPAAGEAHFGGGGYIDGTEAPMTPAEADTHARLTARRTEIEAVADSARGALTGAQILGKTSMREGAAAARASEDAARERAVTRRAAEEAAPAAPAGHRISWFVYLEDGVRTRYSSAMTGDLPAWDLTCSCGWDSKTGGATKGAVRKLMAQHKADASA